MSINRLEVVAASTADASAQAGPCFVPATFSQQRLWFLQKLQPEDVSYLIPWALEIKGDISVSALEKALNEIVCRHEALRTTFCLSSDEEVLQVVAPSQTVPFLVEDLRSCSDAEQEARRRAEEESRRPLDLERGPLVRARLLVVAPEHHVLLLTVHHIVFDNWSRGVLTRDLAILYEAYRDDKPSPLPEPPLQYGDYAIWLRGHLEGPRYQKQLEYWKRQLAEAPELLDLPTDRPRPAEQTTNGAVHHFTLPAAVSEAAQAFSRANGVSLFMTTMAVFQALLSRYTGQEDIVIGTPIAGRNRTELEEVIGLFANTLALRVDAAGNPTFAELVGRVKKSAVGAFANQDFPFEKLVMELSPERSTSYNPLFQVLFSLRNGPDQSFRLPGLEVKFFERPHTTSKFDLSLYLALREDQLAGHLEYSTDLFDKSTIERIAAQYETLLAAAVSDPAQRIADLPILTKEDKTKLLVEGNATLSQYPRRFSIHQLFEQQVQRHPSAVACVFGEKSLTYRELNARANQVAHYLRRRGVLPESLVGICLDRSLDMIVSLLGVLKVGATYVPLDPAYPRERKAFILDDANAGFLVTQQSMMAELPGFLGELITLDAAAADIAKQSTDNPAMEAAPERLAYLLYTSGSTGKPKGVRISHRNVVNFLSSMERQPGLTGSDTLLAVTTLSFDIAGLEIYLPLVTGAKIVLASREQATDGKQLAALINRWKVTVLQATPATWRILLESGWKGSSRLKALCGGEALPGELAAQLLPRCGQLWNMYGPTETTIWSSVYPVTSAGSEVISIGRPIANTTMYVLDKYRNPVPIGVPGELYIGGDGVGQGYHNRPNLSAEKFIDDPFSGQGKLYRTGDLVKIQPDGNISYLRRIDDQVKIRGHRIELGEIEAVLAQQPSVKVCAVVVRENAPGSAQLIAYVVAKGERSSALLTEMREGLRAKLPEYMVPSAFVVLPAMPLTPNGKLDRKSLPAPEDARAEMGAHQYLAPRTPLEEKLVAIWSNLLGRERIGIRDDFFELGGHSFLAVRLFARIEQELGAKLPLHQIFRARTIEETARCISDLNAQWTPPKTAISPCRAGGTRTPIFAVPPSFGLEVVLTFRGLAERLDPDQPMHALTELSEDREWSTLEELAAHYIREIREFQPQGPYHLIGWSFGGMIAFEIARQLREQKQEVGLLGMLDARNLTKQQSRRKQLRSFRGFLQGLYHRHFEERPRHGFAENLVALGECLAAFGVYLRSAVWRELYRCHRALNSTILPGSIRNVLPQVTPRSFRRASVSLAEHYSPKVYPGKIVVFQSIDAPGRTRFNGWDGLAEEIEVVPIAGNHYSIFKEPNIRTLAAAITDSLANCTPAAAVQAVGQR